MVKCLWSLTKHIKPTSTCLIIVSAALVEEIVNASQTHLLKTSKGMIDQNFNIAIASLRIQSDNFVWKLS